MSAPPGWNDPPKFVPPPTGNLKINLNKRVAFPLSTTQSPSSTTSQGNSAMPPTLPPMPPATSTPIPDLIQSTTFADNKTDDDLNSYKNEIVEILASEVNKMSGSSSVQSQVMTKLKTLESDWEQCDDDMKKLLKELVDFVKVSDSTAAALIQRKIVMKGCSKQWLHAIRQIIMSIEMRNQPQPESNAEVSSVE